MGSILLDVATRLFLVTLVLTALLTAVFFPWSSDAPPTATDQAELQKYYATAYERPDNAGTEKEDSKYIQIAKEAAEKFEVKRYVSAFARTFGLEHKRVLDIGAGRGYLQDIVGDYTALDISPSVRRFFHKRFVLASATLMPFPANEFDGAWSIWVLEHVPNPEAALTEMRRVIKDGGFLFLAPAWDCTPFAAQGYAVRPYRDFGLGGKLMKASMPAQLYFFNIARGPVRLSRYLAWRSTRAPTTFRYRRLKPNYDTYWMADSDAVNSLDRFETALWFLSRGDECLNCEGALHGYWEPGSALIIKIRKPAGA